MHAMKPVALVLLLSFCLAGVALAWDDAGHLLIAEVAYQRLGTGDRQKLQTQLAGLTEGAHTYNAISAACYMDDLRRDKNLFRPWHYVAPPFTSSGKPLPAGENVVWALSYCVGIYKGDITDARIKRQQALAMIMHLAGDIHQPLHCTSHILNGKNDANGNAIAVTNMPDAQYSNVHAFWDSAFQRAWLNGVVKQTYSLARPVSVTGVSVAARAAALISSFPPPANWNRGGFDPARWALESHRIGYRLGYKRLPGGENTPSVALGDTYVGAAHDVDCQRLVLAGYRLGALLQNLLAGNTPQPKGRRSGFAK